ncbi:MAG TPA: YetF domain-containing protein [Zeimonas sp.]
MWIPTEPWWESVLRAGSVYIALMVLMRVAGKRTLSQLTPFDLLVMLLLSEAVSPSIGGSDDSIGGGLIRAATLIGLNMVFAYATARSRTAERFLQGAPVVLGRDGRLFENVLRREHIGRDDIDKALREAQCELSDLDLAVLEADGQITICKISEKAQGSGMVPR